MRNNKVFLVFAILLLSVFLLSGCFLSDDSDPKLAVSPENISARPGGSTSFTITNDGDGDLNWEVETNVDWLEFDKTSGKGTRQIVVTLSDTVEVNDSAVIEVTSNAGSKEVNLAVAASAAKLSVSPKNINANPGDSTSFTIANDGDGELNWEIKSDVNWLVFDNTEGEGTTQVKVNVIDSAREGDETEILVESNVGSEEVNFVVSDKLVPKIDQFDARGITAPEDKIEPTILDGMNQTTTKSLQINVNDIKKQSVPSGYETGYIFSWKEVKNAEGYEIYCIEDNEENLLVDLNPADLEKVNGNYVYVDVTDDDIGTTKDYKIRAYIGNYKGEFVVDNAVVLPVTELVLPSENDTIDVSTPLFSWKEVENTAGYQLMLGVEDEENIIDRKNPNDEELNYKGGNVEYQYDEELASNTSYYWGILTVAEGNNAAGLSLSKFYEFTVDIE